MSRLNIVKALAIAIVLAISSYSFAGSNMAKNIYESAMTLKPDLENGQEVYVVCSSCHLPEGWGMKDGTYPQIAGQHRTVLIRQLSDIHDQNRDNPTMYPFALPETIGDEQAIADVVAYIEQMKMTSDNGKGDWAEGTTEFENGKKLFAGNCIQCHGENGEGDYDNIYPKIQGQHYKYLLRQITMMRGGKRRSVEHNMLKNIRNFKEAEIAYLVNYVSRMPISE